MISDRLRGAAGPRLKPGYYGLLEFGTLKDGATELALPTRPWRSSYDEEQYPDGGGAGNIPERSGTNLDSYTFADTSTTAENVLKWHLFVEARKYIYIADRCLIADCSFEHINGSNYITGKWVTIDGVDYWCRSLTGGTADRSGGSIGHYTGGKYPNEWDRYIMNNADGEDPNTNDPYFADAPTPEDADWDTISTLGTDNDARKRDHNQAWNWIAIYSWTNDVTLHDNTRRSIRGDSSARMWNNLPSDFTHVIVSWRPALIL